MSAVESRAHVAETTFINEWADYHRLDFTVNTKKSSNLGMEGQYDALDVLEVLRNGEVTRSDMEEDHGLWTIVGETVDDDLLEICVLVRSSECSVELVGVVKI
ncbi:MAG: hypothetical protein AAFQ19_03205 [Pseudomonadota bacterium]